MDKNQAPDDFESPFSEIIPIEHRGKKKDYRFAEMLEEDAAKLFGEKVSETDFANVLVAASVTDVDGTPVTLERLHKMPHALVQKLQLQALKVNGYDAKAEDRAGESSAPGATSGSGSSSPSDSGAPSAS